MASERTPLIRTAVVVQQRPRYPHSNIRRAVSTVLFVALFAVVFSFLIPTYTLVSGDHDDLREPGPWKPIKGPPGSGRNSTLKRSEAYRKFFLETPSAEKAAEWSRYYTSGQHVAGKNLSQAEWTRDLWQSFGIRSKVVPYEVYINYPKSSRIALLETKGNHSTKVKHECSLEEDVLEEDPTTSSSDRVPAFHGYSASGNVTAQFVYVNFGTVDDYKDLHEAGVPLKGKIALAKYGRNFRGIKVQLAQLYGMSGVIMYSDPQEDGEMTELNGYKAYPEGPARNPSSIQRGSVQYLSTAPGDPTTIGYPSKPGVPRGSPNGTTPQIPSLPISYKEALPLLKALNGHGPSSKDFNKYWQGGGLGYLGVKYDIGPSPPELTINLHNDVEYEITPLWDVIGIVNGTGMADQSVVVGNHRDAWIVGGAADPNSGSAVLNEIVRSFGEALDQGWKPPRTTIFGSWDGEEYGLLGSTEWVEEFVPWLNAETMSYLNVDGGASGPNFHASASPLCNRAIKFAAASVVSPNQTVKGQTVYDVWHATNGASISTLGSGSDYTAFFDLAGVSSVDLGFAPSKNSPVYHYHSNYDSYHWMEKYGDRGFRYHETAAKVLGTLTFDMVNTAVIPYVASDYSSALLTYIETAQKKLDSNKSLLPARVYEDGFWRLLDAAKDLQEVAEKVDAKAARLMEQIRNTPFWWRWLHGRYLRRQAEQVNTGLKLFERAFLYEGGLPGRSWFKHVVFAPGKWTGYAGATLPGLIEAIDEANLPQLQQWEIIVFDALGRARGALEEALP